MSPDDKSALIITAIGLLFLALCLHVWRRWERELIDDQARDRMRELREHEARIKTVGYGPPQIVRRSPLLTEEDIVNRADARQRPWETPAERRARKAKE
jgi:hypothetical protein